MAQVSEVHADLTEAQINAATEVLTRTIGNGPDDMTLDQQSKNYEELKNKNNKTEAEEYALPVIAKILNLETVFA